MNTLLRFGALAALGLSTLVPALAQAPPQTGAAVNSTRNIRVLTPEVSRSLRITRIPTPTQGIIIGFYYLCRISDDGSVNCANTLVACTSDQEKCVEV